MKIVANTPAKQPNNHPNDATQQRLRGGVLRCVAVGWVNCCGVRLLCPSCGLLHVLGGSDGLLVLVEDDLLYSVILSLSLSLSLSECRRGDETRSTTMKK